MQRDMDLIREILLALEARDFARLNAVERTTQMYHNYLLVEAGLAVGNDFGADSNEIPQWRIHALTWKGHEFLESARDVSRWTKAKEIVREKAGSVSFDVLKKLLMDLMQGAIGIG